VGPGADMDVIILVLPGIEPRLHSAYTYELFEIDLTVALDQ